MTASRSDLIILIAMKGREGGLQLSLSSLRLLDSSSSKAVSPLFVSG